MFSKNKFVREYEGGKLVDLGALGHKVSPKKYVVSTKKNAGIFERYPIESCDFENLEGRMYFEHGFIDACHRSFAKHLPLEISPDTLWLLICQAVSTHESCTKILGKVFNLPKEKKKIIIVANDFVKGSENNDWVRVFGQFEEQIGKQIPETLYNLIANKKYSTTSKLDTVCYTLCLMDSLKNYFSYGCYTMCYIPQIYVQGKLEDWEKLYANIAALSKSKIGLDFWFPILLNIVQNFIDLYSGKCNENFWNSVYKWHAAVGSGGVPTISGWVCAFFPYIFNGENGKSEIAGWTKKAKNIKASKWMDLFKSIEKKEYYEEYSYLSGIIVDQNVPNGINGVPFDWNYLGSKIKMKFHGGFMGVKQNPKTLALSPALGWAVGEDKDLEDSDSDW